MLGKAYCKLQATLVEWQQIVVCCRGPPTRHVTLMNFGTSKQTVCAAPAALAASLLLPPLSPSALPNILGIFCG